jgi:hypothetical protein
MQNQIYFFSMLFTGVASLILLFPRVKDNLSVTRFWRLTMLVTAIWSFGRAASAICSQEIAALYWIRFSYCGSICLRLM